MESKWYNKYKFVVFGVLVSAFVGTLSTVIGVLVPSQKITPVSLGVLIALAGTAISLGVEAIIQLRELEQKFRRDDLRIIAPQRSKCSDEFVNLKRIVNHKLDILSISLGQALGDFIKYPTILNKVFEGLNIRLLFLHPSSGYILQRAREDGVPPKELKNHLIGSVKKTVTIFKSLQQSVSKAPDKITIDQNRIGSIEIRIFDDNPYGTFFKADNRVLWGLYLSTAAGFNHAMFDIPQSHTELHSQLTAHFNRVWHNSADDFLLRYNRRTEEPITNDNLLEKLLGKQWYEAT